MIGFLKATLNIPFPIVAGLLVQIPQIQGEEVLAAQTTQGPEWLMGAMFTLAVVGYFLKLAGKFPGMGGERRGESFSPEDKDKLNKVHQLLASRNKDGDPERYIRHFNSEQETAKTLLRIEDLLETIANNSSEGR